MCLRKLITGGGKFPRSVWSCAMLTPRAAVSFSKSFSCPQEWEKMSWPLYLRIKATRIHKCLWCRKPSILPPTFSKTTIKLLKYFICCVVYDKKVLIFVWCFIERQSGKVTWKSSGACTQTVTPTARRRAGVERKKSGLSRSSTRIYF